MPTLLQILIQAEDEITLPEVPYLPRIIINGDMVRDFRTTRIDRGVLWRETRVHDIHIVLRCYLLNREAFPPIPDGPMIDVYGARCSHPLYFL